MGSCLGAHRTVLCDPGWGPALLLGLSLPDLTSCPAVDLLVSSCTESCLRSGLGPHRVFLALLEQLCPGVTSLLRCQLGPARSPALQLGQWPPGEKQALARGLRGQRRWASSLAGDRVRALGVGSALGRVPAHLCPQRPPGQPRGAQDYSVATLSTPGSGAGSTATALFLPCPHGAVCLSQWEHRGVCFI